MSEPYSETKNEDFFKKSSKKFASSKIVRTFAAQKQNNAFELCLVV